MDDRRLEGILGEYLRLEEAFLDLTSYIPLVPELTDPRYAFASPRAAEFGLDCGTWIETLFRELLDDGRWNNLPGIAEARATANQNVEVFRSVFGTMFIRGGYSLRWFDPQNAPEIRPFEEWANDQNPEWFRTYSRFKHDRFELAQKFTMGHALKAFVALTILVNHWIPAHHPGLKSLNRPASRVLTGV